MPGWLMRLKCKPLGMKSAKTFKSSGVITTESAVAIKRNQEGLTEELKDQLYFLAAQCFADTYFFGPL